MKRFMSILGIAVVAPSLYAQYTVEILHNNEWPQSGCFGAASGQQAGSVGNLLFRAVLWRGAGQRPISLHDPSWQHSFAFGTDGHRQVGYRSVGAYGALATMWSGSADSWINLSPAWADGSVATAIHGDVQVGIVQPSFSSHVRKAVLWRNTSESTVMLHPIGWETSEALGTDGIQHVGHVNSVATSERAVIWQEAGPRFVNLHPDGYHLSIAYGVAKGQQVGRAAYQGNGHAALWQGSKASFVDLNPSGIENNWGSVAYATNGFKQVGVAASNFPKIIHEHAAVWSGTRESYMNLHQFLPAEYQGYLVGARSQARAIDADGVISGFAYHLPTQTNHAVIWRPIHR